MSVPCRWLPLGRRRRREVGVYADIAPRWHGARGSGETGGGAGAKLLNILSASDYFCGGFRAPGSSDDKRVCAAGCWGVKPVSHQIERLPLLLSFSFFVSFLLPPSPSLPPLNERTHAPARANRGLPKSYRASRLAHGGAPTAPCPLCLPLLPRCCCRWWRAAFLLCAASQIKR